MASEVSGKLGEWCPRSPVKRVFGGGGKGKLCQRDTGQGKEDQEVATGLAIQRLVLAVISITGNQKPFLNMPPECFKYRI